VRAIVLDPEQTPVSEAKVWSSLGGEPMRVEGGWLFTIPAEMRPKNAKLTLYANVPSAFLKGTTDVKLGEDHYQTVTVRLARPDSARVRGVVQDEAGRAIKSVRVSVVGYGSRARRDFGANSETAKLRPRKYVAAAGIIGISARRRVCRKLHFMHTSRAGVHKPMFSVHPAKHVDNRGGPPLRCSKPLPKIRGSNISAALFTGLRTMLDAARGHAESVFVARGDKT
jgi:hypothetical protein